MFEFEHNKGLYEECNPICLDLQKQGFYIPEAHYETYYREMCERLQVVQSVNYDVELDQVWPCVSSFWQKHKAAWERFAEEENGYIHLSPKTDQPISFDFFHNVREAATSLDCWITVLQPFTFQSWMWGYATGSTTTWQKGLEALGIPVFVKLSSLSPKDVGIRPVTTAEEVVELFSASSRIRNTLDLQSRSSQVGSVDLMAIPAPQLVARAWCTDMPPSCNEFRCFVRGHTITAISSYDTEDGWETRLTSQRITTKIKTLHNSMPLDSLPFCDYTMDVVIWDEGTIQPCAKSTLFPVGSTSPIYCTQHGCPYDESTDKCCAGRLEIVCIELNTFGAESCAGSALYRWKPDFSILYFGDMDLRITDRPLTAGFAPGSASAATAASMVLFGI